MYRVVKNHTEIPAGQHLIAMGIAARDIINDICHKIFPSMPTRDLFFLDGLPANVISAQLWKALYNLLVGVGILRIIESHTN